MKFKLVFGRMVGALCVIALLSPSIVAAATPDSAEMPIPSPAGHLSDAVDFAVNAQMSAVNILVYRAGALALFGHNHVLTVGGLSGQVRVRSSLEQSDFDLSFPVSQLMVDDRAARTAAGRDFSPDVPHSAREGTRRNMLRPEVLDAEHYSQITLRSVQASGTLEAAQFLVNIQIKDVTRDIPVFAAITIDDKNLTARGQFEFLQSDFGIKPFSAALGTLKVRDRVMVNFVISAQAR